LTFPECQLSRPDPFARAIAKLVGRYRDDPGALALVLSGSVAKGFEREDSDIDFMLVVSDEEFEARRKARDLCIYIGDLGDYPGGYGDGKRISLKFMESVAERGTEPARFAFVGAKPQFSRLKGLEELLARITAYPEHERADKIEAFYGQMEAARWFVGEAERHGNRYLLTRFAADLVLFGGRLILAHNRVLYPFHKWMHRELERVPEKPAGFMEAAAAVIDRPGEATAVAFRDLVAGFRDWGVDPHRWPGRFMEDSEMNWLFGKAPVADR